MTSKKTVTAQEAEKYCLDTYGLGWMVLLCPLEGFADYKSLLTESRDYLLTSFGYEETSQDLDTYYDIARTSLQKNDGRLLPDEAQAFIKLYETVLLFDDAIKCAPDDNEGFKNFCLTHSLWPRLEEQAQHALALFKKNKNLRTKPS